MNKRSQQAPKKTEERVSDNLLRRLQERLSTGDPEDSELPFDEEDDEDV